MFIKLFQTSTKENKKAKKVKSEPVEEKIKEHISTSKVPATSDSEPVKKKKSEKPEKNKKKDKDKEKVFN